ncbi:MAG: N-6 DNA methylase, partial [Anaerolineales bacterium]
MNDAFEAYVEQLESLAQKALTTFETNFRDKTILSALDGGPRLALNSSIPLELRRNSGVFFTGSSLAKWALRGVLKQVNSSTVFLDPACGAGDLLLSCVQKLPVEKDLEHTLEKWGQRIAGFDLRPEFVRAAKARLFLAALSRGNFSGNQALSYSDQWFPLLKPGNCFKEQSALQKGSMIVMNPPYQLIDAPENCCWASGKVSSAALFVDYCVSHVTPNSRIIAILPDVLRSGSRYADWRDHISESAEIERVTLSGQFDQWTDIHVFILQLRVTKPEKKLGTAWNKKPVNSKIGKVGDDFEVHVGAVVPYRDKKIGKNYPYLIAKNLSAWDRIDEISRIRRFSGTVYEPPFVVVRRTSRPGDRYRAI